MHILWECLFKESQTEHVSTVLANCTIGDRLRQPLTLSYESEWLYNQTDLKTENKVSSRHSPIILGSRDIYKTYNKKK